MDRFVNYYLKYELGKFIVNRTKNGNVNISKIYAGWNFNRIIDPNNKMQSLTINSDNVGLIESNTLKTIYYNLEKNYTIAISDNVKECPNLNTLIFNSNKILYLNDFGISKNNIRKIIYKISKSKETCYDIMDGYTLYQIEPDYRVRSNTVYFRLKNDYSEVFDTFDYYTGKITSRKINLINIDNNFISDKTIIIPEKYNNVTIASFDNTDCDKIVFNNNGSVNINSSNKNCKINTIVFGNDIKGTITIDTIHSIKKIIFDDKNIDNITIPNNYKLDAYSLSSDKFGHISFSNDYERIQIEYDQFNKIISKKVTIDKFNKYINNSCFLIPNDFDIIKINNIIKLNICPIIAQNSKDFFLDFDNIVDIENLLILKDNINCLEEKYNSIDIYQTVSCIYKINNYIILSNGQQNLIIENYKNTYLFEDNAFKNNVRAFKDTDLISKKINKLIKTKMLNEQVKKNNHIKELCEKYNLSKKDILNIYHQVDMNIYKNEINKNNKKLELKNNT